MPGKFSRDKGRRNEIYIRDRLRQEFPEYSFRRGLQYQNKPMDSGIISEGCQAVPDIISDDFPIPLWIEVKSGASPVSLAGFGQAYKRSSILSKKTYALAIIKPDREEPFILTESMLLDCVCFDIDYGKKNVFLSYYSNPKPKFLLKKIKRSDDGPPVVLIRTPGPDVPYPEIAVMWLSDFIDVLRPRLVKIRSCVSETNGGNNE